MSVAEATTGRFSSEDLARRAIERRAVETVNWGIPVVSCERMHHAMVAAGGAVNQIAYMPRLQNWRNQTLTPNPDLVYFIPFIDTKHVGPMVLEIPPADEGSITGTVTDWWQSALEDVGPAGADKGEGGKYLILPPQYQDTPPDGYILVPSDTYRCQALLHSVLTGGSEAELSDATAYGWRIRLYPLTQAADRPETVFLDVSDRVFDATIRYDLSFFRSLDDVVQHEPWLGHDTAMIDILKSIGIEKGRRFNPDVTTRELLEASALEAQAWFSARFETSYPPYYEGRQWVVFGPPEFRETLHTHTVDERGLVRYYSFSGAKRAGGGPCSLFTVRDKDGRLLDGGNHYRIRLPAHVPVDLYWSAVAYERATQTFFRHIPHPGVSSRTSDLVTNADGTVDMYIGRMAPGSAPGNWIPTKAGLFELCVRFYGPGKPLFDKTWTLPDVERV